MTYGLIPIAPDNTGFQNLESLGVRLTEFSVQDIIRSIEHANGLTMEEIEGKRELIYETVLSDFKPESFSRTFETFISKIN